MGLKVCLISVQYVGTVTGGGGIHVVNLSKELAKLGNDVYVLSMGVADLSPCETVEFDNAKVQVKRFWTSDSRTISNPFEGTKREEIERLNEFCDKVLSFLMDKKFDVIHLHGHFMVPSLAKKLKERGHSAKIVTTFHAFESIIELTKGEYHSERDIFEYIVKKEKEALLYSDAIIIASKALITDLSKIHGNWIRDLNLKIIPSGVNDIIINAERNESLVSEIRREFDGDYLLFNLNRIDPSKKVEYIIRALPYAYKLLRKRITLVIAGKFEQRNMKYKAKLTNLAKEVIKEYPEISIHILENISEGKKILFFDSADAFIMSSPTEPFGITILEAMARGTPIIVSDAPGPREIFHIEEDFTSEFIEIDYGLMVNFRDEQKCTLNLGFAIANLLKNIKSFKERANKMKDFVKQNYSWSAVARKVMDVYNEILQERKRKKNQ